MRVWLTGRTGVAAAARRFPSPIAAERQYLGGDPAMEDEDFPALVREYLALLERAAQMPPHDLLSACARLLPRIYAAGLCLPEIGPDDASLPRSVPPPELPSLGKFDLYGEVYDPYIEEPPVTASLANDLVEIYSELAEPLGELDAGRTANAIWSWRFAIRGHCGDHLVNALRTIHRAIHDHMPPDYDPDAEA